MRALLYLQLTSMQGRIRSRFRRLKQPKYLIGAVIGVAYLYFVFLRRVGNGGPGGRGYGRAPGVPTDVPSDVLPVIASFGALALLIVVALCWIVPRARASLAFSEAEIAFLFPAPISRRTLIHYRLLKSQLGLAFSSLVLAVFSNRWGFVGGNAATHAVGWWIILATMSLHFTGSSFTITRLLNRGVSSWTRSLTVFGLLALVVAAIALWVWLNAPAPSSEDLLRPRAFLAYLSTVLASGPLPWLLAVPKLVLAPFLAHDVPAFAFALVPALAVLGAHYAWVLFAEVSFEEASVSRAEKRAARTKAMQDGKSRQGNAASKARSAPFALAAAGRPEVAFLWKNLLSTPSFFRPITVLIAAGVIVAGCMAFASRTGFLATMSGMALMIAVFTLVLGPQLTRYDLRADLLNSDLLKTYPMRGWQIVLGELLTPIAILTAIVWLALLAAALATPAGRMSSWLNLETRAGIAIGLGLLTPPFCALQLLVPNALTVLFPAWVQLVSNRGEHGLDVMGQRIIFLAGQLLVMAIALLPAALAAAVMFLVANWLLGTIVAVVVAFVLLLAILIAEAWVGVRWLGQRFERFDLSSELRA